MEILKIIEEKIITKQQEIGFNAYVDMIGDSNTVANEEGFINFYGYWCIEEGRFNDIQQTNFK